MERRTFLATGTAAIAGLAGCLGGDDGGSSTTRTTADASGGTTAASIDPESDGHPPAFEETPDEREIDTDSFDTTEENGVDVPLAPIEATYYWYKRREARFADARGRSAYEESHVYGAVSSPAGNNLGGEGETADPVTEWPKGDRIVCYCGCPHHLSAIRASELINEGYEEVYVIDEGFWEWHDRGYQMAGSNVEGTPEKWVITGRADAEAGTNAWARHRPSGQREVTDIAADGRYELHLRFHEVGPNSMIEVETPAYTVEGRLKDLASGTVRG